MLGRVPGLLALARLVVATIRICMRYRVTGLASEAGFFALLSLPPLILGLVGGLALRRERHRPRHGRRRDRRRSTTTPRGSSPTRSSRTPCSPRSRTCASGPRFDLLSLGFVLSLWSGSRALNVFVDTISIMYGQSGVRGIIRTRALSFSLYLLALALGIVTIPLVLLGPDLIAAILPQGWDWLIVLYWPLVTLLTVGGPHQPVPRVDAAAVAVAARRPRRRGDPAPLGARLLRRARHDRRVARRGTSIYGPLSAPIVLLIWLYTLAIAVLIGAAANASVREL